MRATAVLLAFTSSVGLAACSSDDVSARRIEELAAERLGAAVDITCHEDLEGDIGATTTCAVTDDDGTVRDLRVEIVSIEDDVASLELDLVDEP